MAYATSPRPVPPFREPKGLIVRFYREILALFRRQSELLAQELLSPRWEAATEAIRAHLGIRDSANDDRYRRSDDLFDDLREALRGLWVRFSRDQPDRLIEDIVERYGREVNEYNVTTFRRQFKAALGIDVIGGSPRAAEILKAYTKDNVSLIKTIESDKFARVQQVVERNWRIGARWEKIAVEIKHEFELDDFKAMRIARDQVGKLNGELNRDRMLAAGVERGIWRTAKDSRVREAHRRLEGKIFDIKKGHPREGIPGWSINCRCYWEPVFLDPDTGEPEGPLGELDTAGFPKGIGYGPTSGGSKLRWRKGPRPPAPKVGRPKRQRPR